MVCTGPAVFCNGAEAGAAVMILLERLQCGAVFNAEAAQIAEANCFAGALQAARALRHHLGLAVRNFVLDVIVLALFCWERLQAQAWLLYLGGERHNAQELRLRLGECLSVANLRKVETLEVCINGVGATSTVSDGGDYGCCAVAQVAAAEDAVAAGLEGNGVGLHSAVLGGGDTLCADACPGHVGALADRLQDAIALNDEFRPWCRLWPSAARSVRNAELHANELESNHLVVRIGDDTGWASLEDGACPLFDHLVHFVGGWHVLHVAAVDEGDLLGPLTNARSSAVHGGVAATNNNHAAPLVVWIGEAECGGV